jgi:hypothetical protein
MMVMGTSGREVLLFRADQPEQSNALVLGPAAWSVLLDTAVAAGWQPAGARWRILPTAFDRVGFSMMEPGELVAGDSLEGYKTRGVRVLAEDATRLADALERTGPDNTVGRLTVAVLRAGAASGLGCDLE